MSTPTDKQDPIKAHTYNFLLHFMHEEYAKAADSLQTILTLKTANAIGKEMQRQNVIENSQSQSPK